MRANEVGHIGSEGLFCVIDGKMFPVRLIFSPISNCDEFMGEKSVFANVCVVMTTAGNNT